MAEGVVAGSSDNRGRLVEAEDDGGGGGGGVDM